MPSIKGLDDLAALWTPHHPVLHALLQPKIDAWLWAGPIEEEDLRVNDNLSSNFLDLLTEHALRPHRVVSFVQYLWLLHQLDLYIQERSY